MQLFIDVFVHGRLSPFFRQATRYSCFYLLPLASFIAVFATGRELAVGVGAYAFWCFFVVLLSRPFSDLFPQILFLKLLKSLRKELGVLSFWLVVAHVGGMLFFDKFFPWEDMQSFLRADNFYFWGFLGFFGMLYLAITSNTFSVKLLKKFWKRSHVWVVYPTMIASIIHVVLVHEPMPWAALGALYIFLQALLFYKKIKGTKKETAN